MVFETFSKNMNMLQSVVNNVEGIHKSMESIRISAYEINQAMEASSADAERLSYMTNSIHDEANQSVEFARQISEIDDKLSGITSSMLEALKGGRNAISNDELLEVIINARESHKKWIERLGKMVDENRIYPLQTNSKKCVFGHFYYAIKVDNPNIKEEWESIEEVHHKVHSKGDEVIEFIEKNNTGEARRLYEEAREFSKNMIAILDSIEERVIELTEKEVEIFR